MGSVPAARARRSGVTGGRQTFRSPTALIFWWVWVAFALANLIDLAVQGRDREALVAAAILVLATGVAYVCALRPRILADSAGVTVVNPLRDHHAGWAMVTSVDLADLLRVRCQRGPDQTKAVYAWAVHYSRRKKMVAQVKASRQAARAATGRPTFGLGSYGGGRLSGYGVSSGGYGRTSAAADATPAAEADAERIVAVLNEYVTAARAEAIYAASPDPAIPALGPDTAGAAADGPDPSAPDPSEPDAPGPGAATRAGWSDPLRSTWSRTALLAVLIPTLLLLLAIFG